MVNAPIQDPLPLRRFTSGASRYCPLTKLIAIAGVVDIDAPLPAITIMLPDKD